MKRPRRLKKDIIKGNEEKIVSGNEITIGKKRGRMAKNDPNPRKRNKLDYNDRSHRRDDLDNIIRKIKHLVIKSLLDFMNNKLSDDNRFKEIKLLRIDSKEITNAGTEHNIYLLSKTVKDIFSLDISRAYKKHDRNHNIRLLQSLMEHEGYENILNLTFIDCVEYYAGSNKNVHLLQGMKRLDDYITDEEEECYFLELDELKEYHKNLRLVLNNYRDIICGRTIRGENKKKEESKIIEQTTSEKAKNLSITKK